VTSTRDVEAHEPTMMADEARLYSGLAWEQMAKHERGGHADGRRGQHVGREVRGRDHRRDARVELAGARPPPEPAQNVSGPAVHLGHDPLSERSVTRGLHRARCEHSYRFSLYCSHDAP
jgi:hypothetical protein